jgi:hypothetical protein
MDDLDLSKMAERYQTTVVDAGNLSPTGETLLVPLTNRKSIADSIERLIDMLDAMSPDPDLEDTADDEPSLGSTLIGSYQNGTTDDREGDFADFEDSGDTEHSLGWGVGIQVALHASDEREEENEHGGNVTDEPHDAQDEGDYEPNLGWGNRTGQSGVGLEDWNDLDTWDCSTVGGGGLLGFTGEGYAEGKAALRQLEQTYVQTSAGIDMDWWRAQS